MTPAEARQFAEEFVGVFAPAMPPQGWEKLIAEMDGWTDAVLLEVDEALNLHRMRLHCQAVDCYEVAEIASVKTSNHYCMEHWRRVTEPNWNVFEISRHDTWR